MKNLLLIVPLIIASISAYGAHHGDGDTNDGKQPENNFAYMSSYTMPAGSNAGSIAESLLENVNSLEESGYNSCGLLRHQFGGDRAFYSYCFFDSWDQFGEINDASTPVVAEPDQLFGDHSDNIVAMVEKNLSKKTPYVLMATYSFGPYLTDNEKRANAKTIFDAYDSAFGGCNMMEHFWGPEQAWYFVCGYENYADFAKKVSALSEIHEKELANVKLDVMDHSDDLMIRVE